MKILYSKIKIIEYIEYILSILKSFDYYIFSSLPLPILRF